MKRLTIACLTMLLGLVLVPSFAIAAPIGTGWTEEDGQVYYLNENGNPLKGWQELPNRGDSSKKSRYHFNATSGAMDRRTIIDDGSDGKRFVEDDGTLASYKEVYDPTTEAWYWVDSIAVNDGRVACGKDAWIPNLNKWVRYDSAGRMVKGEDCRVSKDDGKYHWWYFDPITGEMQKGFSYVQGQGKWCYYDPIMGWMLYGVRSINGAWYLLNETTGAVSYGMQWVSAWKAYRHFAPVTGRYEGNADYIDWTQPSGGTYPTLANYSNLSVEVSTSDQLVYIKSGNTVIYTMICSAGTGTTTPRGSYTVSGRGTSFYNQSEQMGARWWVNFLGYVYLFHSVPTDASGNYIVSEAKKLGQPASHGCIRLTIPDAKYLYEQLPDGTRVRIS